MNTKTSNAFGWLVVGVTIFFYIFEFMIRSAPNALLNQINLNFKEYFGVINVWYMIPYVPMQLFVGPIMDAINSRYVIIFAVFLCNVGLYIFGHSIPSEVVDLDTQQSLLHSLYIGRFMIGFGSAFAFVAIMKIASIWLPKEQLPLAAAIGSAMGMIGNMLGQGMLTQLSNNHSVAMATNFFLVIGSILLIYVLIFIREKDGFPVDDGLEISSFKSVLSNMYQVIISPQVWICGLIGAALYMPITIFSDFYKKLIPIWYSVPEDYSTIMFMMLNTGFILGAPLSGFLASRYKRLRLQLNLSCCFSAIWMGFMIYFPIHNAILANLSIFILGLSLSSQVLVFAAASFAVEKRLTASAVALTNMIVMLPGLLEVHFNKPLQAEAHIFAGSGIEQALLSIPIALSTCFLISFLLKPNIQYENETSN